MVGSATFTMDISRAIINCAADKKISVSKVAVVASEIHFLDSFVTVSEIHHHLDHERIIKITSG